MQYTLSEQEQFIIKRGGVTIKIPMLESGTIGMGNKIDSPEAVVSGSVASITCTDSTINNVSLVDTPEVSTVQVGFPPIDAESAARNFYVSVMVSSESSDVSVVTPSDVEVKDFNGDSAVLTASSGKMTTFHFVEILAASGSILHKPAVFAVEGLQYPSPGPVIDPVQVVLPFFMRRKEEGSSDYIIYLPSRSIKYGKDYISFSNISHYNGDWYFITDIGSISGNIWCLVGKRPSGEVYAEFVSSVTDEPPLPQDILTYFKVAKINPSAGQGLYDGVTQVAAGQAGLLPDDLADMEQGGSIGSGDTRVPFLVYPDRGDDDSSDDESEGSLTGAFMYLPAGSLTIEGREVEFAGTEEDYIPVTDNTSYWCEIFKVVGKGIENEDESSDTDSSDSESSDQEEMAGLRYMAVISSEEVPNKDAVLRFKITTVKKGVDCDQIVFGSVTLGPLPDYSHLVAWQIVKVDYEDSISTRKLYRMFVPAEGTIAYNGFMLPIENASNGWYELEEDIGKMDSTYRYYCVIYNLTAYLFTEDEYNDFIAAHAAEQSNIQAKFIVAEVVTGDGGDESDPGADDWDGKTVKALIVTTENGYIDGVPHLRPGANADFTMWSGVFGNMTTTDNIMHLADGQTDMRAVSKALDIVCNTAGLTIFMISTHGGADGSMEVYNAMLTPSVLAQKFAQSPGPVWFIADCCYSGKTVYDASPETSFAAKMVRDVGEYLRANAPSVPYLGWASTTAEDLGWTQEDGSVFTKSCFRNISAGISFMDAWTAISSDTLVTSLQTPTKVVVNGFDETKPIFAPSSPQS